MEHASAINLLFPARWSVFGRLSDDFSKAGVTFPGAGGQHMEVQKKADGTHVIRLNDAPAIGGLRPCANITYKSLKRLWTFER